MLKIQDLESKRVELVVKGSAVVIHGVWVVVETVVSGDSRGMTLRDESSGGIKFGASFGVLDFCFVLCFLLKDRCLSGHKCLGLDIKTWLEALSVRIKLEFVL